MGMPNDDEPLLTIEVWPEAGGDVRVDVGGTEVRARSSLVADGESGVVLRRAIREYESWATGPVRARVARDAALAVLGLTMTALCLWVVWSSV